MAKKSGSYHPWVGITVYVLHFENFSVGKLVKATERFITIEFSGGRKERCPIKAFKDNRIFSDLEAFKEQAYLNFSKRILELFTLGCPTEAEDLAATLRKINPLK